MGRGRGIKRLQELILIGTIVSSCFIVYNKSANILEESAKREKSIEKLSEKVYSDPVLRCKFPNLLENIYYESGADGDSAEEMVRKNEEISWLRNFLEERRRYVIFIENQIEIEKKSREISDYIINYLENNRERIINGIKMIPDSNGYLRDRG